MIASKKSMISSLRECALSEMNYSQNLKVILVADGATSPLFYTDRTGIPGVCVSLWIETHKGKFFQPTLFKSAREANAKISEFKKILVDMKKEVSRIRIISRGQAIKEFE